MNKRTVRAAMSIAFVAASLAHATPVPVLDLRELTSSADVIALGTIRTTDVSNTRCACMPGTHNRAFTRTQSLLIDTVELIDNAPEYEFAMREGGIYWNEAFNQFRPDNQVRVAGGNGSIPVWLVNIADANVVARFTNVNGPERIEWDPEFLGQFSQDVLHHLAAHEIGHALGGQHGGCSQTTTVVFQSGQH